MAIADIGQSRLGREIVLEVEYRDRDLVRAVPGSKWVADRKWRLPLNWVTCLQMRGIFGDRLELGDALKAWAFNELETRVKPALEARALAMDPEADVDGNPSLYRYQRTGVNFLTYADSSVMSDDLGVGKTAQTISTLESLNAYPVLVVAPRTVKRVWLDEFAKWAPQRTVQVAETGVRNVKAFTAAVQDETADVYVINYDLLTKFSRLAPYGSISLTAKEKTPGLLNRHWGAVVADEAHRAKDPKTKWTRALWSIGSDADHRYALTGTPLANTPEDFWALLHFVAPEEWPSRSRFIDRYCLVEQNYYGGREVTEVAGLNPLTRQEFYDCVDPRFLRRPKALVLPQLPEKIYTTRYVEMSPKQQRAYKQMGESMVAWIDDNPLAAFNALTSTMRMLQFANSYATVSESETSDEGLHLNVELAEPSNKCDGVMEILEETDESIVVFAQSRQLIDLLAKRLDKKEIRYGRVTGSDHERNRARDIASFQSGELRVILCTLGAGSSGITLTKASTVVFMQRSFSAVDNTQAEDRIHRIGQEASSVTIIDLIAPGTIEETVVLPALQGKAAKLEEITRDRLALRNLLKGVE